MHLHSKRKSRTKVGMNAKRATKHNQNQNTLTTFLFVQALESVINNVSMKIIYLMIIGDSPIQKKIIHYKLDFQPSPFHDCYLLLSHVPPLLGWSISFSVSLRMSYEDIHISWKETPIPKFLRYKTLIIINPLLPINETQKVNLRDNTTHLACHIVKAIRRCRPCYSLSFHNKDHILCL